jgi:predicted nuclease of restriction endonuclease-like (RecB) superfamily
MKVSKHKINNLADAITVFVKEAKTKTAASVNAGMLVTYWYVGKLINELEKSEQYDDVSTRQLLIELSSRLTVKLGPGFSRNQLIYMRLFHQRFNTAPWAGKTGLVLADNHKKTKTQSGLTLSDQIGWSHYIELLKLEYNEAVTFYMHLIVAESLSVRELRSHIKKALFERVALSKSKKQQPARTSIKTKSNQQAIDDFYRDPLILDFLNIPSDIKLTEKKLEQAIIDNLQQFILELAKGFAFVGRQYRIGIDGTHYYIDLVFYHYILKCFVLMDLKIDGLQHQDIGQMNMYLNYFKTEKNTANDNPPIGIILTNDHGKLMVEYALGGISNNIFVRKYQLYLPDKRQLEKRIKQFFLQTKRHK